jgi:hypothetical protein
LVRFFFLAHSHSSLVQFFLASHQPSSLVRLFLRFSSPYSFFTLPYTTVRSRTLSSPANFPRNDNDEENESVCNVCSAREIDQIKEINQGG